MTRSTRSILRSLGPLAALAAALFLGACASAQQTVPYSTSAAEDDANNPFGVAYQMPCAENDNAEYFTATGVANGSKFRMDVLQQAALSNAQNIIRQKMKHAYTGVVNTYVSSAGTDKANRTSDLMERGGDQAIDAIVATTFVVCGPSFSAVDEAGYVNAYVGVRISKAETVNRIAQSLQKEVARTVSDKEKAGIHYDAQEFQEHMSSVFKTQRD